VKRVDYFFAMLSHERKPGRFYKSRWRVTREDAERRGGTVLEGTAEAREIPKTQEERATALRVAWGAGEVPGSVATRTLADQAPGAAQQVVTSPGTYRPT